MKENEEKAEGTTRRDFVKTGAVAAAAFSIVPRFVLGKGYRAPSDTLYYATVGFGGKGSSDNAAFVASGKAKPQFLCDVDPNHPNVARVMAKYPDAKRYEDWREMIDKESKNFDALHTATPDHSHAVIATAAMSLGKHVYVQKPFAHDVWEARQMMTMADKYKVVSQMGNQGSSGDGVRMMMDWFDAGLIGDVKEVYCWTNRPIWPQGNGIVWPKDQQTPRPGFNWDLWQGTAKTRPYAGKIGNSDIVPFGWRGWWDYGTGVMGDMGAHILHAPMKILGLQHLTSVQTGTSGGGSLDTGPNSNYTIIKFPKSDRTKGPVTIHWMDGGIVPPRPEELDPELKWPTVMGSDGGMMFVGTKGKMLAGCYAANPRLLPAEKFENVATKVKPKAERVKGGEGGHYAQWVEACLAGYGKMETSSPFREAGLLCEMMLVSNMAIRAASLMDESGRRPAARGLEFMWDAANLKMTNNDAINQFVKREYRDGWHLSGI